ncbi:unnamed protein product [Sphagnum compactum]
MNEDLVQVGFGEGMKSDVEVKKSSSKLQDVEMMKQEMVDSEFMDEQPDLAARRFLAEIESEMERVKEIFVRVENAHNESKALHRTDSLKTLWHRMDNDIALVNSVARRIGAKLEDRDRAKLMVCNNNNKPPETETGDHHARTAITATLRKSLKDLMNDSQMLRQSVMDGYRDAIERRYIAITGEKPDNVTVGKIIETGESENFLQIAIHEQGWDQVLEATLEIKQRHDAVAEIAKSLQALDQLFLDMEVHVKSQCEQLNDKWQGSKRRHEETVNAEIVNQALEAMTTALSSSADGAAIKDIPSVRKSQSFSSGPAGRVLLHVDTEGAAVPAAGVPEPSTSTLRGPFRRVTPMGWFPRGQKKESYLERKIRMLQQKEGGTVASLDETLGAANLHVSCIEREKRAAAVAAKQATEARKAALVEASWCRILKAAGLPYMSAAMELQKVEKKAAEALAAAAALGVILGNNPRSPRLVSELDPSSNSHHHISTALETAFDVDKEVVAALKAALLQRMNDLEEAAGLMELLNATSIVAAQQLVGESAASSVPPTWVDQLSEQEQDNDANHELNGLPAPTPSCDGDFHVEGGAAQENPLVESMLMRVKDLQPEQCTALATIVATRGLSDLLQEENLEQELGTKTEVGGGGGGGGGLGDILVKHVSRLEAEKAAALAAAKSAADGGRKEQKRRLSVIVSDVPDLGGMFVRHLSRLEREKQQALESKAFEPPPVNSVLAPVNQNIEPLEKMGVKKISRLETEKQLAAGREEKEKEFARRTDRRVSMSRKLGMNESLIKHKSKLEKEVEAARARRMSHSASDNKNGSSASPPKKARNNTTFNSAPGSSLSDILVKHKSRLEREKEAAKAAELLCGQTNSTSESCKAESASAAAVAATDLANKEDVEANDNVRVAKKVMQPGLADVAVQKLSKLEMEKQAMAQDPWERRRPSFKAKEIEDLWAGISLGDTLKRHVSKLEQEQAAWRQAEEEAAKVGSRVH